MAKPNEILVKFKPQGHKELIRAIERLATAQKKLNGSMKKLNITSTQAAKKSGILDTRNKRLAATNGLLANSFATIRSKMLLWSFAMSLGIRQLAQMGKEAAVLEGMERAFGTLSGGAENASIAIDKLREATNNTMSDFDLFQQANNAMILGVSRNSTEMAEMFDIAQRLGRALGRDTRMSVESLITGIGRQSRMMLDNIGIIVKADEAYEAYAKQLKKSTDDLTDSERKQAFLTATMESARQKVNDLGEETLTTVDAFDKFTASTANLRKRLGDTANAFEPIIDGMSDFLDAITDERIDRFVRTFKLIGKVILNIGAFVVTASALFMSFGEILAVLGGVLATIYGSWILLTAAIVGGTYALLAGKDAITDYIFEVENLADKLGETAEEHERLNREFEDGADTLADIGQTYETAAIEADRFGESVETLTNALYFQMQAQDIVRELYGKTKQGQLELINSQLAAIDSIASQIGMTEELAAVYEYLLDQKDKLLEQTEEEISARQRLLGVLTEEQEKKVELAQATLQIGNEILGQWNAMTSAMSTQVNTRMNNEIDALKSTEKYRRASSKRRADMEHDVTKKYAKERERVAKFEKASAIAGALINTALAVTKVAPNLALMALVATLGGFQVSAIATTPLPKYARGGLIGGRRHSQGGTMIEAEQGEFIMNRNAVDAIGTENLNRMNQGGGRAVNISFSGNVMSQDFIENEAIPQIKEAIRRGADIGVS